MLICSNIRKVTRRSRVRSPLEARFFFAQRIVPNRCELISVRNISDHRLEMLPTPVLRIIADRTRKWTLRTVKPLLLLPPQRPFLRFLGLVCTACAITPVARFVLTSDSRVPHDLGTAASTRSSAWSMSRVADVLAPNEMLSAWPWRFSRKSRIAAVSSHGGLDRLPFLG